MTMMLFGYLILGPSTHILIFLNPQIFLSGYGFRPHAFGSESGHLIFKSALQSGKKNSATDESDIVWMGESGYFRVP